jgi:hypothetical protein
MNATTFIVCSIYPGFVIGRMLHNLRLAYHQESVSVTASDVSVVMRNNPGIEVTPNSARKHSTASTSRSRTVGNDGGDAAFGKTGKTSKSKTKRSFWDKPSWFDSWAYYGFLDTRGGRYALVAIFLVCTVISVLHRRWLEAYLMASPFLVFIGAYLVNRLPVYRRATGDGASERAGSIDAISCLGLMIGLPVVGLVGLAIFGSRMLHDRSAIGLLAWSGAAALWLLIMLVAQPILARPPRSKPCIACGQISHYVLMSETDHEERLCRTHFMDGLRKGFDAYDGRFVIVEHGSRPASKRAQYIFYEPEDLLEDSCPESDVQGVELLISSLLPSGDGKDSLAVIIPNHAVKNIGNFDEKPLLQEDASRVTGHSLDKAALLSYLERVIADYDYPGCELKMDIPHGESGIYLWHDYV